MKKINTFLLIAAVLLVSEGMQGTTAEKAAYPEAALADTSLVESTFHTIYSSGQNGHTRKIGNTYYLLDDTPGRAEIRVYVAVNNTPTIVENANSTCRTC